MAELRIRVGASLERSVEAQFQKLDQAAARAGARVKKEMKSAGDSIGAGIKPGVEAAARALNKLHDELAKSREGGQTYSTKGLQNFARDHNKAFASISRDFAKTAKDAERFASVSAAASQKAAAATAAGAAREAAAIEAAESQKAAASSKWRAKYFTGVSPGRIGRLGLMGAGRAVFGMVGRGISRAERMAVDIAHGAGIETDPGAFVKSFTERQAKASDIAHSGYIPGATGPNGIRQNAGDIQREAMSVATANAQDPEKVLAGLQKFVSITGDLDTGRKVMGDMAKLALATGSNMEEVVDAAGEISAKLGDIPDKANVVHSVMRQIAGAGKMGAVEMRDFAAQLGKIAGYAARVGGNVDQNIGEMGLLMQVARQKGGAGSAAQAATSVSAFMETLATPAKLKKYEAITGYDPYVDKTHRQLQSPEAIIIQALKSSGGDVVKLHEIFGKRAANITMGAANVFNQAGAGEAGAQAVAEYFDQLRGSVLSLDDENKAAAEQMNTAAAMAQRFNNKLQEIADEAAPKLMAAFTEMGPGLIDAAHGMVDAFVGLAPYIKEFGEFLGLYFGRKPNQNPQDVEAEIGHLKTINALGTATPEDITKAEKIKAGAGQDVLNSRQRVTNAVADVVAEQNPLTSIYNFVTGKDTEKNLDQAQKQYESDEKRKNDIADALGTVMQKVFSGAIKVEVVNKTDSLHAPQGGRQPADADQPHK